MTDVVVDGRGVTKTYEGDQPTHALGPVDICVTRGEVLALVGASGSGKSTLLHLVAGLARPSGGSLRVLGVEIDKARASALIALRATHVSLVFQDFYLDATKTATENVALPLIYQGVSARSRAARAEELLDRVALRHRMGHLPSQLSGGEKQRVAIARALVTRPGVLLADEPTGNLDSVTELTVLDLLLQLARADDVAVVMATHSDRVASAADTVLTLKDGLATG
jgi:ABC-type lipoprotein export system ATPase subunit